MTLAEWANTAGLVGVLTFAGFLCAMAVWARHTARVRQADVWEVVTVVQRQNAEREQANVNPPPDPTRVPSPPPPPPPPREQDLRRYTYLSGFGGQGMNAQDMADGLRQYQSMMLQGHRFTGVRIEGSPNPALTIPGQPDAPGSHPPSRATRRPRRGEI